MSWNQGGGGKSPWGKGPGGGFQPPDFESVIRAAQAKLRQWLPGGFWRGRGVIVVFCAIVLLWLASGFYRVQPDEEGIVLRFGAFDRKTNPGLNYHFPVPIEEALTPKVTRVNRIEIGYRADPTRTRLTEVPEESLMLTGDENIVDINFTVFYLIKDAPDYLFSMRDPDGTVKVAAESAMREVIGHTEIAQAFAEGRGKIETDTQHLLQDILDSYHSGIEVTQVQLQKVDPPAPVIDAFRDVQSAKIDQQRLINEAQAYANNIVPVAHGDAARVVQEAEAYRQQIVRQAEGDAARFNSVYDSYRQSPDVTARRIYIETMQAILQNTNKVIIDRGASSSGVVPYLPLPGLAPPAAPPAAPAKAGTP